MRPQEGILCGMRCVSLSRRLSLAGLALTVVAASVYPIAQAGQSAPRMVVVVRHAERASSPADDPPLSEAGRRRAEALAAALADARIDAVITTDYERTRMTAAPLALARKLEPVVVGRQDSTATTIEHVIAAVRAQDAAEAVLVVGHSNTVARIVAGLGGPRLPELCDGEYSNLFILVTGPDGTRLVRGHYGQPDPPDAAKCGH